MNNNYRPHLPNNKQYLSEVHKKIHRDKPLEEINFKRLNHALEAVGVEKDPYACISLETFDSKELNAIIQDGYDAVQRSLSDKAIEKTLTNLWDYLAEEDELKPADVIVVMGGPGIARVERAVEMYQEGVAPKIMFTGGHASYIPKPEQTEAEYYQSIALDKGVKEADIIVEAEARNTPESGVNAATIFKQWERLPQTIIAITLPYHMRRSWLTMRAAADWDPEVIRQTVPSGKFTREDYFYDFNGWSYVFNEYIKLYGARLMEHF